MSESTFQADTERAQTAKTTGSVEEKDGEQGKESETEKNEVRWGRGECLNSSQN